MTGGESYYDSATNQSISVTDGSVISNRGAGSAHHIERGARDVDIRSTEGFIKPKRFKAILKKYTKFNRAGNKYKDKHWHVGLPNYKKYHCSSEVCTK